MSLFKATYQALALSLCASLSFAQAGQAGIKELLPVKDAKLIRIEGRIWQVAPARADSSDVSFYRARRAPMPDLQLFGPPGSLRTLQAIRAIEGATGCTVYRKSLYQDITADIFATVRCN